MASLAERLKAIREGQEVDDATKPETPAIDSSVSLIGTRDTEAIRKARLRAKRVSPPKPKSDITSEEVIDDITRPEDELQARREALAEFDLAEDDLPLSVKVAGAVSGTGLKIRDYARGVKVAYNVADLGMEKGKIGHRIKTGKATAEDHKRLDAINQEIAGMSDELKDSPFIAKSFGTLAPFLVESAEKGGKGALTGAMIGGTTAFIAGQLGPQAATPEEVITVPAATALGAKIGSSFNSVTNIAEIEGGSAYLEMVDMGMDPDKAAIASDVIGTGSGLLELAQFKLLKRLLPGSDKIASSALAKAVTQVVGKSGPGRGVSKLAAVAVPEAGIETTQELWNNIITTAATDIRKDLDKTDLSPKEIDDYIERYSQGLWETFATTVTGFGVAAIPGVSIDVALGGTAKNSQKVDDGQTVIVNDEKTDPSIGDVAEAEEVTSTRPTVKDLLGVNDAKEQGTPITEEGDGMSLSEDMTMTPKLTEDAIQRQSDLSQILDKMRLKKKMQADKLAVISNQSKLSSLNEAYESAVFDKDPETALKIAQEYQATIQDSEKRMGELVNTDNQLSAKKNEAVDPRTLHTAQAYIDEQKQFAEEMVIGQSNAVAAKEAQEAIEYNKELNENPDTLNQELTRKEVQKETKPEFAKLYRTISDMIDLKNYVKPESFFKKTGQIDKLLKMRGDLTRKIQTEVIDQKVSETDKAVDNATLNWVNKTIEEAVELEEAQTQADINKQREDLATKQYNRDVQQAKERTVKEGKESQTQKRVAAVREREAAQKKTKQVAEQKTTAKKVSELDKRRQAISKQAKETRKQPATPVSAERKAELEASKKRKVEIKKQQEIARQLGDKDVEAMKISPVQKKKAQQMFRSAGISIKGKVYEGKTHGDAVFRNDELQKFLNNPKSNLNDLTEGFVTKGGKFVNRKKASELIDAPNLQSESFVETLKNQKSIGHTMQLDGATFETVEEIGDVYDLVNKDKKYGWFHTMAKAMGVKTNVIFGKEGLNKNVDFQKQEQLTKQQIIEAWDGVTGIASKSTFTNFLNAENLLGNSKAKTQETIAHETLHGVVRKKLAQLGKKATDRLEQDLKQLWDSIPSELKAKAASFTNQDGRQPIATGIKQIGENIQELITYGLTSPDFAAWLNSIPSLSKQGVQTKQSVWERLVNLIAKLVNPSKLTDLVNIMNSHLDLKDPGFKPPTPPKGPLGTKVVGKKTNAKTIEKMVNDARSSLDEINQLTQEDINQQEYDFLESGNDGMSPVMKIHEWRDGAANNIDRMAHRMEQEYLQEFGGKETLFGPLKKSSKIPGLRVGSGLLKHTTDTLKLQNAMNLFLDSGQGKALDRVTAYRDKLVDKGDKLTSDEMDQLQIIDRMLNMTDKEKAWAENNIRKYYDEFFAFAKENQIIDQQVDNYVKRNWQMPKKFRNSTVTWSGGANAGFKLRPDSAKQRARLENGELKILSIVDGWEAGMQLKTMGAISNLQAYAHEIGYTFANRRFVDYMRNQIEFKTDGLMFEVNPKTSPDFKPGPGYIKITDRGFVKPGHTLYAEKELGTLINKISRKPSWDLWENPAVKVIRKINSVIKSTLLSVSLFHHLAGFRSFFYGVGGAHLRGVKGYREGLKKLNEKTGFKDENYKHLGPIADLLVREGLTVGRTQDWDEIQQQDSIIETFLGAKSGKLARGAQLTWRKMRRSKDSFTTGLFGRLFAGLKVEAGAYELVHTMKKREKELGRKLNDREIKLAAQQVATLINADFGGLHLQRMGRNPNFQRLLQLGLLAPDWTESNWRTVTGALGLNNVISKVTQDNKEVPGMAKMYRKFWRGILIKAAISVGMAQAAVLYLVGDEDDREDYWDFFKSQIRTDKGLLGGWETRSKGRWAAVDMTPVYRRLGIGDPDKRQVFQLLGHFKDILKIFDFMSLIKHKVSPAGKALEGLATMSDWKKDEFEGVSNMIKDMEVRVVKPKKDPFGGGDKAGSVGWIDQLLGGWLLYNLKGMTPIALNELISSTALDESSFGTAAFRSFGVDVRDITHKSYAQTMVEDKIKEVNELDKNLRDAKAIKDRDLIREAKQDIKDYPNYNRTKARLGLTKTQVAHWKRKAKPLLLKKKKDIELTPAEQQKLRMYKTKMTQIYEKSLKILNR